jgi:hypothetical protein
VNGSISVQVKEAASQKTTTDKNLLFLQTLGAITGRGEFASKQQRAAALAAIDALEEEVSEESTVFWSGTATGRWELVYSSTQLFRSSPFFLAARAVCQEGREQKQFDWFCDMHRKALAISQIGAVRQVVSEDKIVNEFEVSAGTIPFLSDLTPFSYSGGLPLVIAGAIVSTADIVSSDSGVWTLYMDTVEIKGSNVPGLRQILDSGLKLQSRSLAGMLEQVAPEYATPRPVLRTTFLSNQFRISRDQDGNAFVYVKVNEDSSPTDYSSIDSDLGIGRLLEGFNDAVTQFYL